MFYKPDTQTVFQTHSDIRAGHPNTSLPENLTTEVLSAIGVYEVSQKQNEFDPITQSVTQVAPAFIDGKWTQQWATEDLSAEKIAANQAAKVAADRAAAKSVRALAVGNIKVTTASGNTFDGDETSQTRMARALAVMGDTDTLPWVLSDNTIANVGKAEMHEALRLSGAAMAAIWITPYTGD